MKHIITKASIPILSILIILGISLNINIFENQNSILEYFKNAYYNEQTIVWCVLFILVFLWMRSIFDYNGIYQTIFSNTKISIISAVLSALFAFFEIAGNSLQKTGSFYILHGRYQYILLNILKFMGLFILFWITLYSLYTYIDKKNTESVDTIWKLFLHKRYVVIFLIICWIPYIVAFYPCSTAGDTFDQIRQFFHIPVHEGLSFQWSTYYDMVNLISEDVLINQHHPIIHTTLIGICVFMGHAIGNDNFGLFLYVIFQIGVTSSILAYILVDSHCLGLKEKYRKILLLVYAFVPVFPMWAVTISKDSLHAMVFLLYTYFLIKISYGECLCKTRWKEYLTITVVQLFLVLTKSTGIYIIVLSSIFFAVKKYKKNKELFISMLMVCFIQIIILQSIVYPLLKISPGGGQEMWSVPCNQIARYAKEYKDTISEEDGKVIDKVIYYDYLADWYHEDNADHIKNSFHINATAREKIDFIKVWWKYFCMHPEVYIVACADLCYQYFYPQNMIMNPDNAMGVSYVVSEIEGFEFYDCHISDKFSHFITDLTNNLIGIPLLGMLVSSGFYTWILFIALGLVFQKKEKGIIMPFVPILLYILILIVGPRYLTRYALILFYSVPLLMLYVLSYNTYNLTEDEVYE